MVARPVQSMSRETPEQGSFGGSFRRELYSDDARWHACFENRGRRVGRSRLRLAQQLDFDPSWATSDWNMLRCNGAVTGTQCMRVLTQRLQGVSFGSTTYPGRSR